MPRGTPNPKPVPPPASPAPMILIEPAAEGIRFNAYGLDTAGIVDALRLTMQDVAALRQAALFDAHASAPTDEPCRDGRRTGERLAGLETMATLHSKQMALIQERIDMTNGRLAAREARQAETERQIEAFIAREARLDENLRERMNRMETSLAALEIVAANRRDGGFWITCSFCADDETGMCSACNGTRRIWEMPREDGL